MAHFVVKLYNRMPSFVMTFDRNACVDRPVEVWGGKERCNPRASDPRERSRCVNEGLIETHPVREARKACTAFCTASDFLTLQCVLWSISPLKDGKGEPLTMVARPRWDER